METISKYLKRWYLFVISIVVCIGLAFVYLLWATPVYSISTTLLIQEDKKGDGILNETAFSDLNMFHTTKTVDNEMQILRSIDLLRKVFQSLSMQTKFYDESSFFSKKELYGKEAPLKIIVYKLASTAYADERVITMLGADNFKMHSKADNVDKFYKLNQVITTPDYTIKVVKGPAYNNSFKTISFAFVDISALAGSYSDIRLDITPVVKDANTIVLTIKDNKPQRGLDILNTLIDYYNKQNVENKNKLAIATINFIDGRMKFLTNDLSNAELNVQEYKQSNMVTDINSDAQVNLNRGEDYKVELQKIEVKLSIVRAIESYFNDNNNNQSTLAPSAAGLDDPILLNLLNKLNDLQQEYQRLLRNNESSNPLVVSVKDEVNALKLNIQENLKNIKVELLLNRNNLAANSSRFDSRIKIAPAIEKGLLERNREQLVKGNLFAYLSQKREETALSLSAALPDAQIVDSPNYNTTPDSPKKMLILLCAFMLGGILPIFQIYGKDVLNKKISSSKDLVLLSNVKILGELSHNKVKENLVIGNGSRTSISELFRYIRMNLNNDAIENKVILVTSSTQGEGKTFLSLNLGATLSLINKKVVVLEFDLRRPDMLKKLKVSSGIGITEYLMSDDITAADIVKPSNIYTNMWVVGSGKLTENPSELLSSHRLGELFAELRQMFDYIIIDTSPIGLVADAFSFKAYSDLTIYLVRYNYTRKEQLTIMEDLFKNNKLTNPMIVLNDAKPENLKNYGYASSEYSYAE
jgi:tyrosine-protein kinase Etk/Wzc